IALLALRLTGCQRTRPAASTATGPPQRIVSQTIVSDEVLWSFGPEVQARVVAVSRLADDRAYSGVAGQWPASVQRAPLTSEAVLASEADLVIVADFTAIETRELLANTGVNTLTLTGFSGFADWRANTQAIADAVGDPQAGHTLVAAFDDALRNRSVPAIGANAVDARPTAVSWSAGNVAGRGTSFDDVAAAAGLRNLAAEQGIKGHKAVTIEQLVAWDPQVLVVACEGVGDVDCGAVAAQIASQPGIAATQAARNNGVLALPSRVLYSAGWSMLDAVTALREHASALRSGGLTPSKEAIP
ncbi:MAG: ABC transporter substrate-binding protein, partial [Nannocystaceae bacterium]|nr:ABC transporter substrate-binding protein [Nannocystaceae bacterium]